MAKNEDTIKYLGIIIHFDVIQLFTALCDFST